MAITKENAAEMARLSHAARKAYQQERELAEKPLEFSTESLHDAGPEFRNKMLARARAHIEKLQERIDDLLDRRDLDTKAMRELADTVMKLEVVEQKLSNRPAPAAMKVSAKPRRAQELPAPEPSPE